MTEDNLEGRFIRWRHPNEGRKHQDVRGGKVLQDLGDTLKVIGETSKHEYVVYRSSILAIVDGPTQ